ADGGASAAALLETMRVLQAGPPLDNDLLFVFTDADTVQAMGARAFMQSHPWAKQVRVALRFDNAGNRGPLELIDAAHADGFALDAWARAAPQPQGSSFMAELYDRLPQSGGAAPLATDAFPVLHFATTQGPLGREGMHDVPQRL
ncbi:M28 family peptidase, partial [Massilia sp. CT11-108]|uniref:M28 family peptidase n=1 Tax=Massilia sp. CT11-108 TaxID=3393900 RepID=UPI0039A6B95B